MNFIYILIRKIAIYIIGKLNMHLTAFEMGLLLVLLFSGVVCVQFFHTYSDYWDDINSLWGGAITGALATLIVLHFNRKEEEINWNKQLGIYTPMMTRIKQGEPNKSMNIPRSKIEIKYVGNRKLVGEAEYEGGNAKFEIVFERENLMIGSGVFQYVSGLDHIGTYSVQRDFSNINLIHIYYKNTIPDNQVTGYETWSL